MTDASTPTRQEFFKITSVCRKDLEVLGFDTSNVDDENDRNISRGSCPAITGSSFFQSLGEMCRGCDIPRNPNYAGSPFLSLTHATDKEGDATGMC